MPPLLAGVAAATDILEIHATLVADDFRTR
jgi:hypothetical protein